MTPAQERWAFAAKLIETHGDDVGDHLVNRINALTEQGDEDGLRFWIDIAGKIRMLAGPDEETWMQ